MATKGDITIFGGCIIHLLIWLFVAFGGFFSDKIIFLNIFIILPLIYVAQSSKHHPITKMKIKYILEHEDEFFVPEPFVSYCYNRLDSKEVEQLEKELGRSKEDVIKAFLIMQTYENSLGFPYALTSLYRNFCDSYKNPFDAQGLIVFAYMLNSLAFLSKHYNLIFKRL